MSNRFWLLLNFILSCVYLSWRIFFTIPFEYGWVSITIGVSLLVVEALGMFEALVHYYNMHKIENHLLPIVPKEEFPDVDVFIATYNEPIELLYKTINGCRNMDYPQKEKVHIYLCDDGRRPQAKKLAEDLQINYLDREDNRSAKAGNLNHAMSMTDSPLIVTFDADMIPKHDFLMKTVPYFVDAEIKNRTLDENKKIKLGFIQTPQSFYNPDLFQFNLFSEGRIPNEQDYFYKDIQVSRNKSNSVIYGGSNTVLSRKGLEEIGGFYTEAITEDFATGILLQKAKYICYATNEVLASGLSATELQSLIQQRIRWARGVISTGKKMHIFTSRELTFAQKINYWASIWYWYAPIKRLIYIMSPIMFATFGYMVVKCNLMQVLIFWLPMYISSNICLKMLSRNIRTTKWTSVYETVLFPYMLIPVIAESLGISLKKFKITNKGESDSQNKNSFIYTIPFLLLIGLSVIGIFNSAMLMFGGNSIDPIILLFWLISNLFSLVMSLFFVRGRDFLRKSERVLATVECQIQTAGKKIYCMTKDFSESGVSVLLAHPIDIDDKEIVLIRLEYERYHADLKARVVHVDRFGKKWKYAFQITDMCGNYDAYLQILYDRIPTLPTNLDKSLSTFDDLRLNISKRVQEISYENRKLARIPMNADIAVSGGKTVHIVDFNYKYLALSTNDSSENFTMSPKKGLSLECKFNRTIRLGLSLYEVTNFEEIHRSEPKRELLAQWITEMMELEEEKNRLQNGMEKKQLKKEPGEFSEMDHL